jgi:hypothetical protein
MKELGFAPTIHATEKTSPEAMTPSSRKAMLNLFIGGLKFALRASDSNRLAKD